MSINHVCGQCLKLMYKTKRHFGLAWNMRPKDTTAYYCPNCAYFVFASFKWIDKNGQVMGLKKSQLKISETLEGG